MKEFQKELFTLMENEHIDLNEPMKNHTTFRVGGPADFYVTPTKEQLCKLIPLCQNFGIPYLIIGNGSNLLVSDKGIRGVVIEVGKNMNEITVSERHITAQAGALLSRTAMTAAQNHLTGMEFAAGIPGCVGGAVVMNAGAYGGEMKDIISKVTVLTKEGKVEKRSLEELDLAYRHSSVIENEEVVLDAEFILNEGIDAEIAVRMADLKSRRVEKQPLEYPSAGSTFKRPEGYFAGKLIMDAGLRGFSVGGAAVSEKHCGFVINKDHATADDVYQLMQNVKEKVWDEFHVVLEPEVKMVGDFS